MYENDYMYAIERNPDYLAHYGIKGMRWGVRKAIESGNANRLSRQYTKALKKLTKLEKRANSGAKYARRAAALGAGAALAGHVASKGVSKSMAGASYALSKGATGIGKAASDIGGFMTRHGIRGGGRLKAIGQGAQSYGLKGATKVGMASNAVKKWESGNDIGKALGDKVYKATTGNVGLNNLSTRLTGVNSVGAKRALEKTSNSTFARLGAGALGVGLGAAAGYNAYRAATTKRAARKADEFRKAMNESFRGTKYANGGNRQGKKRRR